MTSNIYILLDILQYFYELCHNFDEPVGFQRYYTTKRLIRDLLFIYRECVTEEYEAERNWHRKSS